jgi:hypothetical protein
MKNRLKHIAFLLTSGIQLVSVMVFYVWEIYLLSAFAKAKKELIAKELN